MLLAPSTIIAILLVAGTLLALTGRFRRIGLASVATGTLVFLLLANGWTATWLLAQLEFRHPAGQLGEPSPAPTAIVLLTGYAQAEPGTPITGQLNRASAVRVLEAARLATANPLPVYVSGYDQVPELLAQALRAVTSPDLNIHVDPLALSTRESAVNLKPYLQTEPFYLVTSAGHMPRSLAVFEALGMRPIPAPTDFLASRDWHRADWLPTSTYLDMSELAIHEYMALLWYRVRGWL